MSTVEIEGVSKRYDGVTALDDVTLTIGEGEFFGLLGPSGSGKTTLLRSIAGFLRLDAGAIRIDGRPVEGTPVHRRQIGMVFQSFALFPHLSVFDNVAFGLSVRGRPKAEVKAEVMALLGLVRLDGLERRRPRQLSGGQQQRVALARALITRPRVLLLDEPLGSLDKRLRQQMQVELKQIQREVGITAVFVTHDQEEALTLSDRIALFDKGKVIQVGRPQEVYERPRTVFAADFLGDANFLAGRVIDAEAGITRIALDQGGEIHSRDIGPGAGAAVTIAIRPEKFVIEADPSVAIASAGAVNRLHGTVSRAIYSGTSIAYGVRCGALDVTVFQQNRSAQAIAPGSAVTLSWDPVHAVIVQP